MTEYKRRVRYIRAATRLAVKSGAMVKPKVCSRCGCLGVTAHHLDPLNDARKVEWLCRKCHDWEHRAGFEAPERRCERVFVTAPSKRRKKRTGIYRIARNSVGLSATQYDAWRQKYVFACSVVGSKEHSGGRNI